MSDKMANRLGLDLVFYRYDKDFKFDGEAYKAFEAYNLTATTPKDYFTTKAEDISVDGEHGGAGLTEVYTIDFANEVSYEIESGLVWATGGQAHSNMVGFKDPTTGTLTITTQIITDKLKAIAAGMKVYKEDDDTEGKDFADGDVVTFMNDKHSVIPQSYIIAGDTLFQDVDGTEHSERLIFYKATVSPAMSRTYTGDGDPQEIEIELELGTNEKDMVHDSIVSY